MALRVLSAMSALKIVVEVGFVVGTIPAITPMGSAILVMPSASSRSITPAVFIDLYLLYMYSEANWFLITLSSTMPIPVSATASTASSILAALAARAAARKILSTFS